MIAVFDSQTCQPLAILQDDHLISDYRTAAAGAVVARLLVQESATNALIVGTGTQARLQAEALLLVRPISLVRIWGRDETKTQALEAELQDRFPDRRFAVATDLERAVRASDVIVTATGAKQPLIRAEDLVKIGTLMDRATSPARDRTSIACLSGLGVQDLTAVNAIWPNLTRPPRLSP